MGWSVQLVIKTTWQTMERGVAGHRDVGWVTRFIALRGKLFISVETCFHPAFVNLGQTSKTCSSKKCFGHQPCLFQKLFNPFAHSLRFHKAFTSTMCLSICGSVAAMVIDVSSCVVSFFTFTTCGTSLDHVDGVAKHQSTGNAD